MGEFFAEGSDIYMGSGTTVGTPGTWNSGGCVINVTPNTITKSFRDVRPCLNVVGPRKIKKKPTTIDYGSFAVTLRFDATQYAAMKTILESDSTTPVAVILGDSGQAKVATCYLETLGLPDLSEDGEVTMTVSFVVDDDDELVDAATIIGV